MTGLDVSREMLALTAKRSRPIPLVHADLFAPLPFEPGAFDAVLALHGTLAHAPDEESIPRLAREVSRVLSPAGVFVAELPLPAWLEAVAAGHGDADDRVARRVGPVRCVYEDLPCKVHIEALILDLGAWCAAFAAAGFATRTEAISDVEALLVARSAR